MDAEVALQMQIRPITSDDREACARILHEAFTGIADKHNFPPGWTSDGTVQYMDHLIGHANILGVVAELDGQVVGFNFLRRFDSVRGVGPICIDPDMQLRGVGRQLMAAVLGDFKHPSGVRLVQEAYNTASLSLYASLGFEVKEFLVQVEGHPGSPVQSHIEVRPYASADADACAALCKRVYGFERLELRDAVDRFVPMVAMRGGNVTAYVSHRSLGLGAHGVGASDGDLQALISVLGKTNPEPLSFILPLRRASFFRWCLGQGFRVIKPLTLMALGPYTEPQGCYFPSIIY